MPLRELAWRLDAATLMRSAGYTPDPWQAGVLRSPAPRILLNCSRQSGKTTVAATKGLHRALFNPEALVLLVSPSLRQSVELFRQLLAVYAAIGQPIPYDALTQLRLELSNGSRLISLPGSEKTLRGFSGVDLLVVDEASRVPDDLYRALRPMLATSGGALLVLSTPFGRRGFFYGSWVSDETWLRVEVPASRCPRISADFLAEERRALGEWWFRQEYLCAFELGEGSIFHLDDVEAMYREAYEPWDLGTRSATPSSLLTSPA
jgi:hypothetical protein